MLALTNMRISLILGLPSDPLYYADWFFHMKDGKLSLKLQQGVIQSLCFFFGIRRSYGKVMNF